VTEEEWLAATDPTPMLDFLRGKASDRKWRLFGCACCRRVWHLYDSSGRNAVEVAERVADGLASSSDRRVAAALVRHRYGGDHFGYGPQAVINISAQFGGSSGSSYAALNQTEHVVGPKPPADQPLTIHLQYEERVNRQLALERATQSAIAGDMFGNPFRPVAFDPRWRSADAVGLARGIYEDRAFDRLPLLADALMDAGCADEQVLGHCRGDGPHARGCWVVDLVLGKE